MIEVGVQPPESAYRVRESHSELVQALRTAPDEQWIRIRLDEVRGKTTNAKRVSVRQRCAAQGLLIHIRTDQEFLYVSRRQQGVVNG